MLKASEVWGVNPLIYFHGITTFLEQSEALGECTSHVLNKHEWIMDVEKLLLVYTLYLVF